MTNISKQDTSDKGGKFAPGAIVALKTEVQFVDGTYDSDDLFVVVKKSPLWGNHFVQRRSIDCG